MQTTGQNTICIAFTKLTNSSHSTANRLKTRSTNLTWMKLKKELSMQYSIIPSNTQGTQALNHLEQGPDVLLDDYLHHAGKLLSKIYHTFDMSRISAEGTNHYAVVYGRNCRKLKDSMMGHQSKQSKTMEECFRNICNVGVGYE